MKLALKILVPLFIILAITLVVVNIFSIENFKTIFLENKALSFGDHALRESKEVFTTEDLEKVVVDQELEQKFKTYTSALQDPSVFRFKVWDKNIKVVYSDLKKAVGTTNPETGKTVEAGFKEEFPVRWRLHTPAMSSHEAGFGDYLEIIVPIKANNGETIYVLEVDSAVSAILVGIEQAINNTVYLWFGAGLFIYLSFYLLIQFLIIKPIVRLRQAMDIIGRGNLNYEVVHKAKDDMGLLYQFFNNMRLQLRTYLVQLRDYQQQLQMEKMGVEKKVVERTAQLSEEKAKLQASVNSLSVGFIMTDTMGEIITMNDTATRLLCSTTDSEHSGVLTHPVGIQCSMDEIEKRLKAQLDLRLNIKKCLEEQKPMEFKELDFMGRFLHIHITPIVTYEGKLEILGTVILVDDITEAKVIERSKDEFFSIASHELRTPLTSIRGNMAMIKDYYPEQIKDPTLKEMIDDVHESAIRLIEIVNDFLDTSRLEQGKMEFKKETVNLPQIIESIVHELGTMAKQKNVALNFNVPEGPLPLVIADSDKTKQVFYNLVGNALKFTEKGEVRIDIQPSATEVKIYVQDTGRGIPLNNQSLLFHKFQQAGKSLLTRDTTKGTGLGLYISKMMVEKMGGKINLDNSVEGKGTSFVVSLPVSVAQNPSSESVQNPPSLPAS